MAVVEMNAWDAMDIIAAALDFEAYGRRWRTVMLDRVGDFLPQLPANASDWIADARRFASSGENAADLLSSRMAAWRSIQGRDLNFADRDVAAVRAVLCALFPDPDWRDGGDWWMTMVTFFEFVSVADPSEVRDVDVIRARFEDLVPALTSTSGS